MFNICFDNKKLITKERMIRVILVIVGTFIYSTSVNMFLTPHKLIAGGVTGVGIIIEYMIGMSSMSLFLILTKNVSSVYKINDIFLSTLCGGIICGIGMGIVFRCRASEGGTDIISVIIRKKYGMKISTVTFGINMIIVLIGAFLGSVEIAIYTLISMSAKSWAMDKVIEGLDKKKLIFVISTKCDDINNYILTKLGRGVTFLNGEGGYTGESKKIIYCVMSTTQLARAREYIRHIDPKSVITIMDVSEVEGKGFKCNTL